MSVMALIEQLERGDVSRWPKGIFRRAFAADGDVADMQNAALLASLTGDPLRAVQLAGTTA